MIYMAIRAFRRYFMQLSGKHDCKKKLIETTVPELPQKIGGSGVTLCYVINHGLITTK